MLKTTFTLFEENTCKNLFFNLSSFYRELTETIPIII